MAVRVERRGDVTVVIVQGMIKGGPDTEDLQDTLTELMVEQGRKKILLDVSKVDFLGSPAIGVIGAAHGHARDHKLNFWICGMQKRVRDVFALMKFGPELRAFENSEEALESFRGSRR